MKKILLLLVAVCTMGAAHASQSERNVIYRTVRQYVDADQVMAQSAKAGLHKSRPRKAEEALIRPKGTVKYYHMACVINDMMNGWLPLLNVANQIYFSEDGKTLYFGSLFPGRYYCDELWASGQVEGDVVKFDCSMPLLNVPYTDGDGDHMATLRMGELLVNAAGDPIGLQDLEMTIDGERYWVDYSGGMRPVVLFNDNGDGTVDIWNTTYNMDIRPYDGNTTLVELPATAKVQEYIYRATDVYGNVFAEKGRVAVDGDTYYFDSLVPDATFRNHAWVKGTRSGSTITLDNNQFIGSDISYYLYFDGFKSSKRDTDGQYIGERTKLQFNIDSEGVITLKNPNTTFACAFYVSGNQFEYPTFRHTLEPYSGDQLKRPAPAENVKLNTKMLEKYGEVSVGFYVNNVSVDGEYLNPELLSYCIYLDEDLYTFRKSVYTYIDADAMTYIPIFYNDSGNYDIYRAMDDTNVACLYEDMFNLLGVQIVYTVDGKRSLSDIVYVDFDNNVTIVPPAGIGTVLAREAAEEWFSLSGRKADVGRRGVIVNAGKKILNAGK